MPRKVLEGQGLWFYWARKSPLTEPAHSHAQTGRDPVPHWRSLVHLIWADLFGHWNTHKADGETFLCTVRVHALDQFSEGLTDVSIWSCRIITSLKSGNNAPSSAHSPHHVMFLHPSIPRESWCFLGKVGKSKGWFGMPPCVDVCLQNLQPSQQEWGDHPQPFIWRTRLCHVLPRCRGTSAVGRMFTFCGPWLRWELTAPTCSSCRLARWNLGHCPRLQRSWLPLGDQSETLWPSGAHTEGGLPWTSSGGSVMVAGVGARWL